MLSGGNLHYELAERVAGLGAGGMGASHLLARRSGLVEALDRRVQVLKIHQP